MAPRKKKQTSPSQVTRYTHDEVKEPTSPETGHTELLPDDEETVTVPLDNGWSRALDVGRLEVGDERTLVVDLDPAADPVLFWAGKRNRRDVALLPLQRNEIVTESRIKQIIERARARAAAAAPESTQGSLFANLERSLRESDRKGRVEFYKHEEGWKNKLISGDSLEVMESLIRYENLRGKVQMIYVDPPYGIKYNSNFQQRVDKTQNVEGDQGDDVLTVKAFRDTWALGVHSYLGYLAERLYVCRELLAVSGSIFVQISDENVHRVRLVMDEVFGASNFVSQIAFVKTSSQSGELLPSTSDFLLWYARDRENVKYRQVYRRKEFGGEGTGQYTWVELPDGVRRRLTPEETADLTSLPTGARVFRPDNICSTRQGREHEIWPVEYEGREYWPTGASTWKTNQVGMVRLAEARRLHAIGNTLCYVRYLDDFGAFPVTNSWADTAISGFGGEKWYVVQTSPKVISRCIAMTTDAGDLVLDITSGGGTTAWCAESLGRRWIACDSSRVAINVGRQRLLSAVFPHYELKGDRVSDGLRCEKLTRVTLGTIASAREPETIELADEPIPDRGALRVTGPFEVLSIGRYSVEDWKGEVRTRADDEEAAEARLENYISVICRLYRKHAAMQGAAGLVHAVAEDGEKRIALSVGPLTGRVTAKQVVDATQDAQALGLLEVHVLGWAFEANVGEVKSRLEKRGHLKVQLIMIRPDTLALGLKVTDRAGLFSPLSLPVIEHVKQQGKAGTEIVVELKSVVVYDRQTRQTANHAADSGYVAAWYLDEDYDGDCFVDCQMFFDFKKAPSLRSAVRDNIPADEFKLQLCSEPFPIRSHKRIAVKVVDVYGNESTVVRELA